MRTRRNAIVLGVSAAAHLALLAAWMSTRPDLQPAESPTLQVQLVRLPPKVKPQPRPQEPPSPATPSPPRRLDIHPPPPFAPAPPSVAPFEVSPEWRVRPEGAPPDLEAAPFVRGRAGLRQARARPTCKTHGWDRPQGCPPDEAELRAARSDAAKDSRTAGFEAEGRRKETLKTYRESPGASDYPGLRCAIFHKC